MLCENEIKVARVIIPHERRDLGNIVIRIDQKGLGLSDTAPQNIIHRRIAAALLEYMGQIIRAYIEFLSNGLKTDIFVVMLVDIALDAESKYPQTLLAVFALGDLTGNREFQKYLNLGQK
jgi:hypothetical protein